MKGIHIKIASTSKPIFLQITPSLIIFKFRKRLHLTLGPPQKIHRPPPSKDSPAVVVVVVVVVGVVVGGVVVVGEVVAGTGPAGRRT